MEGRPEKVSGLSEPADSGSELDIVDRGTSAVEAMFACSGPGAPAAIAESIRIGYAHAAVAGGLLLASLAVAGFGRRWVVPAALLCLLALHPAWTVSALSGDCGFVKRDLSWVFSGAGCVLLGGQVARGLWSPRAE